MASPMEEMVRVALEDHDKRHISGAQGNRYMEERSCTGLGFLLLRFAKWKMHHLRIATARCILLFHNLPTRNPAGLEVDDSLGSIDPVESIQNLPNHIHQSPLELPRVTLITVLVSSFAHPKKSTFSSHIPM